MRSENSIPNKSSAAVCLSNFQTINDDTSVAQITCSYIALYLHANRRKNQRENPKRNIVLKTAIAYVTPSRIQPACRVPTSPSDELYVNNLYRRPRRPRRNGRSRAGENSRTARQSHVGCDAAATKHHGRVYADCTYTRSRRTRWLRKRLLSKTVFFYLFFVIIFFYISILILISSPAAVTQWENRRGRRKRRWYTWYNVIIIRASARYASSHDDQKGSLVVVLIIIIFNDNKTRWRQTVGDGGLE